MKKLNVNAAHRLSMMRGMAESIIMTEKIETTVAKAKFLRGFVEKIITTAKASGIHPRRQAARHIKSREAMAKLFKELGPRYKDRPGGYTRIIRLGSRQGDGAQICRIELVK
ncbi:50S ribosomal protein L17 [bacterium]|nr:50S ribosomal protein L17 [bacterium]MBU3956243.1 50S ribosomal protein L17 [bacterium]MBU4134173.1 50S ribosomal protein L17 [bacterium]